MPLSDELHAARLKLALFLQGTLPPLGLLKEGKNIDTRFS